MLRGKLPIKLQSRVRPIGFKFLLPAQYPIVPPYVYLDEPENPIALESADQILTGDLLSFSEQQFVSYSTANYACNGDW